MDPRVPTLPTSQAGASVLGGDWAHDQSVALQGRGLPGMASWVADVAFREQ